MADERTELIVAFHQRWGDAELPTICLDLRSSCRGQSDPWGDEFLAATVAYLEGRVDLWQWPSDATDDHVRGMCRQAVWIGRAELAGRAAGGHPVQGLDGQGWKPCSD